MNWCKANYAQIMKKHPAGGFVSWNWATWHNACWLSNGDLRWQGSRGIILWWGQDELILQPAGWRICVWGASQATVGEGKPWGKWTKKENRKEKHPSLSSPRYFGFDTLSQKCPQNPCTDWKSRSSGRSADSWGLEGSKREHGSLFTSH